MLSCSSFWVLSVSMLIGHVLEILRDLLRGDGDLLAGCPSAVLAVAAEPAAWAIGAPPASTAEIAEASGN